MKNKLAIKMIAALAYIGMIVVNILANVLPIAGKTTDLISDSYQNLFAPTGLTFSIWGLIYLLLGLYTLYQFGLFQKTKDKKREEAINRITPLFILSSIANTAWIFTWHYEIMWLSVILMLVLLVSLILIANIIRKLVLDNRAMFFLRAPFAVYFGWITVATIANVIVLLVDLGWNGFGIADGTWTVIILLVGALIGIARSIYDKCGLYILVFIWAYIGIIIKHTSEAGFNGEYPSIVTTAGISIALFVATFGYVAYKQLQDAKKK